MEQYIDQKTTIPPQQKKQKIRTPKPPIFKQFKTSNLSDDTIQMALKESVNKRRKFPKNSKKKTTIPPQQKTKNLNAKTADIYTIQNFKSFQRHYTNDSQRIS
jgi:hypothetical protein